MGKKYYAVKVGKTPGIYFSWDDCKVQVNGFKGAQYKSFTTMEEALRFVESESASVMDMTDEVAQAYVDGSFSKEYGRYSYGCIIHYKGMRYELSGADANPDYVSMNNVAGEILGSMKAIEWAIERGIQGIHIFYDYEGIEKWANDIWKANKKGTIEYKNFIKESRKQIQIQFTKVAAHTGVALNEEVDKLAKRALMEQ